MRAIRVKGENVIPYDVFIELFKGKTVKIISHSAPFKTKAEFRTYVKEIQANYGKTIFSNYINDFIQQFSDKDFSDLFDVYIGVLDGLEFLADRHQVSFEFESYLLDIGQGDALLDYENELENTNKESIYEETKSEIDGLLSQLEKVASEELEKLLSELSSFSKLNKTERKIRFIDRFPTLYLLLGEKQQANTQLQILISLLLERSEITSLNDIRATGTISIDAVNAFTRFCRIKYENGEFSKICVRELTMALSGYKRY